MSVFGSQITLVALPLTGVLVLHADAAQMGVLGAMDTLPFLLVGLFAGVLVDRAPRKRVMVAADFGRMLILGCVPALWLGHALTISALYLLALAAGLLTVFFDVAYMSYLPSLIDRAQLVDGNTKLEISLSVARMAGPGIAGALVQALGAPVALVVDAVSFLCSGSALVSIRRREKQPERGVERRFWGELGEGLGVVFGNRILRAIAGCTATSNLIGAAVMALYALYAVRVLGLTPALFGLVLSIGSAGGVTGALAARRLTKWFGLGRVLVAAIVAAGAGTAVIPLAGGEHWLVVAVLGVGEFLLAGGSSVYNINQVSMRQTITPDRMLGRMNATMRFVVWGTMPIGALVGGVLGSAIGLRASFVVFAVTSFLPVLWLLFSPVRRLRAEFGEAARAV